MFFVSLQSKWIEYDNETGISNSGSNGLCGFNYDRM